ncbi:MAG TPA: tRNA 2-thiouridine(34) synthase MnmA, partial [Vicinamibacterales bacterium]|nr:tRNA 2-thiouridine(34) synthase MnmA [Vicinamibacterales bacterium]
MRIVIAMSGGVDSSVAAVLLAKAGHDVVGLSMQLYDQREGESGYGSCCSLDDLHDAGRVARRLNIPHYIVNFEREFQQTVVANFVGEYVAGRTPIPCSHCNSDLKFATLLDRSLAFGAEVVATGHYARVDTDSKTGRQVLRRGRDVAKDQSYFLFSLTQEQLSRASFPVGDLSKDAVRDLARDLDLEVADKPDSQEICFVPDGDYAAFIEKQTGDLQSGGTIVNQSGDVLGRHAGVHRFTVGQRKGLGIAAAEPLYVLQLRPAEKTVVVGPRPELERNTLTASQVNWIAGTPPEGALRITAQIRHRHQPAAATVRALD